MELGEFFLGERKTKSPPGKYITAHCMRAKFNASTGRLWGRVTNASRYNQIIIIRWSRNLSLTLSDVDVIFHVKHERQRKATLKGKWKNIVKIQRIIKSHSLNFHRGCRSGGVLENFILIVRVKQQAMGKILLLRRQFNSLPS